MGGGRSEEFRRNPAKCLDVGEHVFVVWRQFGQPLPHRHARSPRGGPDRRRRPGGCGGATIAELEDTLEQLHGLECAVRAEFLRVASDIHESGSWRADGARDLAEWLAGKFPISPRHARELARVAEALRDLPAIAEAYAAGKLSWDQLRVLTRYATPATDAELARDAKGLSLRGIEAQARRARRKTASQEATELEQTSMKMWRRRGVLHSAARSPANPPS